MSTAAKRICSALGAGTQAGVWVSLEVAIDAAEKAGVRSIRAHEHLPPTEQLALRKAPVLAQFLQPYAHSHLPLGSFPAPAHGQELSRMFVRMIITPLTYNSSRLYFT